VFSEEAGGTLAEIGLLPFARVALEVAKRVLPPYRSRFSKHQFTQPQLLAVLLLMRYEDWTFREAEVRLGEHRDLREVLQLQNVPDHTTLYRFLKRLEDDTLERGLGERCAACVAAKHTGAFPRPSLARGYPRRPSARTSFAAANSRMAESHAIGTI